MKNVSCSSFLGKVFNITFALCAVILMFSFGIIADAKMTKLTGKNISRELTKCNSLIDPKNKDDHWTYDSNGTECCSKKYGYCIYCPDGADHCNRIPYRLYSNEIKTPEDGALAPTPEETVPSRPGTVPKLKLDAPEGDVLAPNPDKLAPSRLGTTPKLQIQ